MDSRDRPSSAAAVDMMDSFTDRDQNEHCSSLASLRILRSNVLYGCGTRGIAPEESMGKRRRKRKLDSV